MTKERPCKNCKMLRDQHNLNPYYEFACEFERLPLKTQEIYRKSEGYTSFQNSDLGLRLRIIYNPMNNLEYLEWKYDNSSKH